MPRLMIMVCDACEAREESTLDYDWPKPWVRVALETKSITEESLCACCLDCAIKLADKLARRGGDRVSAVVVSVKKESI